MSGREPLKHKRDAAPPTASLVAAEGRLAAVPFQPLSTLLVGYGEGAVAPVSTAPSFPIGDAMLRRLERLREVYGADSDVRVIVDTICAHLQNTADDRSPLTRELQTAGSCTRAALGAYIDWVSHRELKSAPESEPEVARVRALDPGLLQTRVDAIVDTIVRKLASASAPIPDDLARDLLDLFQGAAFRIQMAADTWLLNDQLDIRRRGDDTVTVYRVRDRPPPPAPGETSQRVSGHAVLVETERALREGAVVEFPQLSLAVKALVQLDGGVPMGFQRPLPPGTVRRTLSGPVGAGDIPSVVQATSLAKTGASLASVMERRALLNVAQQSPHTALAISRVEAHLGTLAPNALEHAEVADLYRAYRGALTYDSCLFWSARGVLDRLVEGAVVVGTQAQRQVIIDLMYGGLRALRSVVQQDFRQQGFGIRDVVVGLQNFILSREAWTRPDLAFAVETFSWLQAFKVARELSGTDAEAACARIQARRRSTPPCMDAVVAVIRGEVNRETRASIGPYRAILVRCDSTAQGVAGRTLELRELRTDLSDDSEWYEILRAVETCARAEGCDAFQLADWSNIHQARIFRAEGGYSEVIERTGPDGHRIPPTFIKPLSRPRPTYTAYLRDQIVRAMERDLTVESEVLGQDAQGLRAQWGGKALGLELARRLLSEFGSDRLRLLPGLTFTGEQLRAGVGVQNLRAGEVPASSFVIVRSNASFEYGAPPGLLESQHRIPYPRDGILKMDPQALEQAYAQIRARFNVGFRNALTFLVQPQLVPRASGIAHSSFSGRQDEPVIIEASTGPCLSATAGFANLVHYRVAPGEIAVHRNFLGASPNMFFVGESAMMDAGEFDPARRELDLIRKVATELKSGYGAQHSQAWTENTFPIPGERCSPLTLDELQAVSDFARFAEQRLGKPVKLEFSVAPGGTIYLLQLDPSVLEVGDVALDLQTRPGQLSLSTPFVNMPFRANDVRVVIEDATDRRIPKAPFVFLSLTDPLNINIENELLARHPQCQAIITASGSRMNHCYSEARTYIPVFGWVGLYEQMRAWDANGGWGFRPELSMSLRSDGRWGQIELSRSEKRS